MRFMRDRSKSSLRNCGMLSLARKQLFPLPEIVGNESNGVRGTDTAVSDTGDGSSPTMREMPGADRGGDLVGIGRDANGTFSEAACEVLGELLFLAGF
jgi:hypothetical protein